MFVYGNVLVRGSARWAADGATYDGAFDLNKLLRRNICQQAIFYRRQIFSLLGNFNPRYKTCADWDFALRVISRYPIRYIPLTVTIYSANLSLAGYPLFSAARPRAY